MPWPKLSKTRHIKLILAFIILCLVTAGYTSWRFGLLNYYCGDFYRVRGQYQRSIDEFNSAISRNSHSKLFPAFYLQRGLSYHGLGEHQKAIDDYSEAINLAGERAFWSYAARGADYAMLGQYQRAIDDYTKAIVINSRMPGQWQKEIEEALNIRPKLWLLYNLRGEAYIELRQWRKAVDDCSKAISLNPKHTTAYRNRAYAYLLLGERQKEIDDLSKSISLDPRNAWAYRTRARAYSDLRQYQKAVESYSQAISLIQKDTQNMCGISDTPEFLELAQAYAGRGEAYTNLGQYQKAIDDFGQAISFGPHKVEGSGRVGASVSKNAAAYGMRGAAYIGQRQFQKAIDDYTTAISIDPNHSTYYQSRAKAYQALGKLTLAAQDMAKAKELGYKPE